MKMEKYTDEFVVKEVTFRIRELKVPEFAALKQVFATGSKTGNIDMLSGVYAKLVAWLEYKSTMGQFLPVFADDQYVLPQMNDLKFADEVVTAILTEVVPVLF